MIRNWYPYLIFKELYAFMKHIDIFCTPNMIQQEIPLALILLFPDVTLTKLFKIKYINKLTKLLSNQPVHFLLTTYIEVSYYYQSLIKLILVHKLTNLTIIIILSFFILLYLIYLNLNILMFKMSIYKTNIIDFAILKSFLC